MNNDRFPGISVQVSSGLAVTGELEVAAIWRQPEADWQSAGI
jgi:hypothetical protein